MIAAAASACNRFVATKGDALALVTHMPVAEQRYNEMMRALDRGTPR